MKETNEKQKKLFDAPPPLLTVEELAERYRVHPGSVRRWRVEGRGPLHILVGRRVLYPLDEVLAWESKNLQRSTVG